MPNYSSSSMEVLNKYIAITSHVQAWPEESHFEVKTEPFLLSSPAPGDVIIKNLYVSVDPYQLNRMKSFSSSQGTSNFATGIEIGQPIAAYGVGRVVASSYPGLDKDDLVSGLITWGEYCVVKNGNMITKLDPSGFPLSRYVGILGLSGLTAYAGFFEICKPKKGDKVFVSAASGSVGNLAGQYAKLFGCYVVGCAGSQAKVDLLKEKLGFDDAFNYKDEPDLGSALKKYFPEGIDIYFDNVGSEMLEAAVANMNLFGRVAVCGVIAEYTDAGKRAAPNMLDVVYKRIRMQGFLAGDHYDLYAEFLSKTSDYLREGSIVPLEEISKGVESIPAAFIGLFRGSNVGKAMVQIFDD
uniref:Enoyl reductase (ER) domain-containing protein n=1 Tax=Kalanchoe fedtschenkoi TaxID=63787 RepID=A0A7N0T7V9_KALFE